MSEPTESPITSREDSGAASRQLRHADIAITNMFYTDARKRALSGLGYLLKADYGDQCKVQENKHLKVHFYRGHFLKYVGCSVLQKLLV